MYCIEDHITVSPARSVFHPRIKLHQNENLWNTKLHYYWQATNQRTVASPITVPIEKTNHKIILGLWGEDWSHWEGLWSHISCPVRLVPHCCLGTCKENIQITVEHIFKLLRFFLTPNYLNHFKECCSWCWAFPLKGNLCNYAEVTKPSKQCEFCIYLHDKSFNHSGLPEWFS